VTTAEVAALKAAVQDAVTRDRGRLVALADRIHANPELGWNEHRAAGWVAEELTAGGFEVELGAYGLPTAVHAVRGMGLRRVAFLAEYDALPGLGHACGHNLIAAIAVGAALALAGVADELDLTVEVYGTPAEEGGGGKIEMLERGAFAGLDLAMMAHPAPRDVAEAEPFAVSHSHIAYDGVTAHAGAYPDRGVNANDAFVIAQVAIGLLRQQLPSGTRVHGIQTVGGQAPNAIPDRTEGRWYVRADTLAELEVLDERVRKCFEAGALATGATLSITPESRPYSEFRTDAAALAAYVANATALGREFAGPDDDVPMRRASTDMGNVSQLVPAIHPYVGVGPTAASNHQPEFAAACVGPIAERALTDVATALAWTAIDVFAADRVDR
jgi:amidohydrolase